jgi:FkbM family methyltransferase
MKNTFKVIIRKILIFFTPNIYLRILYRNAVLHEKEVRLLYCLCREQKQSLDIGADMGLYSYSMSKYSKKVHSFEPISEKYLKTSHLMRKKQNVIFHNYAISNFNGTSEIRIPLNDSGRSTLSKYNKLDNLDKNNVVKREVSVKTLDSFNFMGIGFIKIDVEGYELEVLQGAKEILKKSKPNLLIEIEERHRKNSIKSVIQFLNKYDYKCFFYSNNDILSFDNFKIEIHQNMKSDLYINNFIFLHKTISLVRLKELKILISSFNTD